jgi:hypothetical protein
MVILAEWRRGGQFDGEEGLPYDEISKFAKKNR